MALAFFNANALSRIANMLKLKFQHLKPKKFTSSKLAQGKKFEILLQYTVARCYIFLSFFTNFFLSLVRACLLLKSLLSPLSLLLYHTISPKLHPLHLTISANSHHFLPIKLTKNTQTSQKITQKLNDKNLVDTIKLPFVNHT